MKTTENYAKEYCYNEGDADAGLVFETCHPEGFVYGSWYGSKRKGMPDWKIDGVLYHAEIQVISVSEAATQYILQEFRKIMKGESSIWRITSIEPRPDLIRLDMKLKDKEAESLSGRPQDLIEELLEYSSVVLDIYGNDIADERAGKVALLELKCQDEHKPEEIAYIRIHALHDSKAECAWEAEEVFVDVKQEGGHQYLERSMAIRWKNKKRKRMIAKIKKETQ